MRSHWRRVLGAAVLCAASLSGSGGHADPLAERGPSGIPRVYYVAPDGSDDPRSGSVDRPWATVSYAAQRASDGSRIVVRPGTYRGRIRLGRKLAQGIVIESETPYQARLRHTDKVIFCWGCEGVTVEGFDIAHDGPGAGPLVVQIDGAGGAGARRVVLRNNVLHDSFRNDILKINNGARGVRVEGNVFYNQQGPDEHIDINSVQEVIVENNIFFNDFAGSQRPSLGETGSFIVIKDSNGDEDGLIGSRDITIRRNVFLGWEGHRAYGFLLLGEDGKPYPEAREVLVENNLFLGDSVVTMRSPFGVKGCQGAVFRNNTIFGDLPGSAFGMRINREGDNVRGANLSFHNNIWANPSGTMKDFSDTFRSDVDTFVLSHNLYWNGGRSIPYSREDAVNYILDPKRTVADPELRALREVTRPRWQPERGRFADGSQTIAEARLRLVEDFARPGKHSAVVDRADPGNAPAEDIRGFPRNGSPDIGAYEIEPRSAARKTGRRR